MAYKDKKQAMKMQNKWAAETLDRINLTVPKGQREVLRSHAIARGEKLNEFIRRAINETVERDLAGKESSDGPEI